MIHLNASGRASPPCAANSSHTRASVRGSLAPQCCRRNSRWEIFTLTAESHISLINQLHRLLRGYKGLPSPAKNHGKIRSYLSIQAPVCLLYYFPGNNGLIYLTYIQTIESLRFRFQIAKHLSSPSSLPRILSQHHTLSRAKTQQHKRLKSVVY